MVAAVGVAAFVRARNAPASNACVNHLRNIDAAKEQWATENRKIANDVPTWDVIQPYLGRSNACPKGGSYTLGRVGEPATCSIEGSSHPPP